jgi:hypothetical protein
MHHPIMPMLMLALAQHAAAVLQQDLALCDLGGNWTSSAKGTPADKMVHIEFFQQPGNTSFTLRATPWGSALSHGHVGPGPDEVHLLFVGGAMQHVTVSDSCSKLSSGWCKFPDGCGFPEPAWLAMDRWTVESSSGHLHRHVPNRSYGRVNL